MKILQTRKPFLANSTSAKQELFSEVRSTTSLASLTVEASKSSPMALSMRASLLTVIATATDVESPLEVRFTKASLSLTSWRAEASSSGQMGACSKASGKGARRMARASSIGPMGRSMKENSKTMSVMAAVCCTTQMGSDWRAYGAMGKRMAKLFTYGLTTPSTMCSTSMARSRVKGC